MNGRKWLKEQYMNGKFSSKLPIQYKDEVHEYISWLISTNRNMFNAFNFISETGFTKGKGYWLQFNNRNKFYVNNKPIEIYHRLNRYIIYYWRAIKQQEESRKFTIRYDEFVKSLNETQLKFFREYEQSLMRDTIDWG